MSFIDIINKILTNKDYEILINGFESSQFTRDYPSCGNIIKEILNILYDKYPLKNDDLYTTSGLIIMNNNNKKNLKRDNKTNSFSLL